MLFAKMFFLNKSVSVTNDYIIIEIEIINWHYDGITLLYSYKSEVGHFSVYMVSLLYRYILTLYDQPLCVLKHKEENANGKERVLNSATNVQQEKTMCLSKNVFVKRSLRATERCVVGFFIKTDLLLMSHWTVALHIISAQIILFN